MTGLQLTFNLKKHIWSCPSEYKDLSQYDEIAIDLETRDEGINNKLGAGWATGNGYVIGFAVAVEGWQGYYPFKHFGGGNMIEPQVIVVRAIQIGWHYRDKITTILCTIRVTHFNSCNFCNGVGFVCRF